MKANYPTEFLAASMTLDMGNTDKLAEFRQEAQRLGIEVVPPSVNHSGRDFAVKDGRILYALAAIKGVGGHSVDAIVEARGARPFTSLADFASRINAKALNKRTMESLVNAGAFDALEKNRARASAAIDCMLAHAASVGAEVASGQGNMFGGPSVAAELPIPSAAPWLPAEKLQREYDAIGFFLTGHPLDDYGKALDRLRVQRWTDFTRSVRAGSMAGRLAATVVSRQERRTKTGNKMGIVGLSDPSGQFEAVLFSEALAQYRELLEPGKALLLQVSAELQGEDVRARIQTVEPLDQAASKMQKGMRVFLRSPEPLESVATRLGSLGGARGDGEVSLVLLLGERGDTEVEVKLPGRFSLSPQIAGALKAVPGVEMVEMA